MNHPLPIFVSLKNIQTKANNEFKSPVNKAIKSFGGTSESTGLHTHCGGRPDHFHVFVCSAKTALYLYLNQIVVALEQRCCEAIDVYVDLLMELLDIRTLACIGGLKRRSLVAW